MLAKTIEFNDYDGNERKETFFFNLTEAEVAEMEMSRSGGLSAHLKRLMELDDIPALIKEFKEIIRKSYGVKSPDGRRFMKSDALFEEFSQTEAYSNLFMELAGNAEAAAAFMNGIVPKSAANTMRSIESKG